jgi:polyhydroxyalkanoate synthesis regulator phasin
MKQITKEENNIKITETVETVIDNTQFLKRGQDKLDFINLRIDQLERELQNLNEEKVEIKKNLKDFKLP